MPAIRPTLTCAFMVVKSQRHGITRSYSRRNCAPRRADTLFSAVRQYAYALPSGRGLSGIQVGRLLVPVLQESAVWSPSSPSSGGYEGTDRKSTRLNSSHQIISYAVFCLKKKNIRS